MQNYPPQFKADAVQLYTSRPEATLDTVAADLGISRETLRGWVRAAGAAKPRGGRPRAGAEPVPAAPKSALELENQALQRRIRELEEERDILRRAAKYFAGETRW
jgi:transposase